MAIRNIMWEIFTFLDVSVYIICWESVLICHILIHNRQLKELVHEKHSAQADVKNLEDQCAAIRAENDSLIHSLRMSSGMAPAKQGDTSSTSEGNQSFYYRI